MSARPALSPSSLIAVVLSLLLLAGVLGLSVPGTARADSAPLDPSNPATPVTVTADPLPTAQINGVAWSQVVVGNTVYVAGRFTRARPAGAAPGTQEVVRNNLLAYDIRTGELIPGFAPQLNAQALSIAATPDGSRIFVGGDFTTVDGQSRSRIAAFDTATGQLVSGFRPAFSSQVTALAATDSTVYAGGWFTAVGTSARRHLAAVSTSTGALLPWAPQPAGGNIGTPAATVMALTVTSGGQQVVVGGRFGYLNGVPATGVGAVHATTGATRPFAVNQLITNQGTNAAVYSLTTAGDTVYGTGYVFGNPGNLEGAFAAAAEGGGVRWINDCHGDSYSSFPSNGALYMATHAHVCSNIGGFPEQNPRVNMYGTAVSLAAVGTTGTGTLSNQNMANKPAPALLPWFPTFYAGSFTGQWQAGWSVTGNSQYVVYGGEFPGVNGSQQQGLVRFAVPQLAPNRVGPRATTAWTPTVAMVPGAARVSWPAVADRDNEHLTYRVHRDSDTGTPVCEITRASTWWNLPTLACADTSASAGSHRYLVTATDPAGNRLASSWVTATVGSDNTGAERSYADLVRADGALGHWPLGETSGTLAYDRAGTRDMTVNAGVTRGRPGAITGDADGAYRFNGTTTGFLSTRTAVAGPQTFAVEAWFQTTSTAGGKIVGFGNSQTGTSSSYDRHLFMDTAGRLHFGVNNGAIRQVDTTAAFNDGRWHHVVGTLDRTGMAFYVDGQLIGKRTDVTSAQRYNGFWRVGGDRNWNNQPAWFSGEVDEVAVYPTALTAAQVAAHHTAGRSGEAPNVAPTAAFTATTADLAVQVDGSTSVDGDGTVAAYAWTFGDGSSGSGATASHTYATAGTYAVTLTVTDDDGATATTTKQVTVTAPPVGPGSIAADTFTRTTTTGWGAADRGGAWTIGGGAANTTVTGGAGQFTGAAGQGLIAMLAGVSSQDVAFQADVVLPQAATGGGTYVSLGARQVGTTTYRATARFWSTGQVDLRLDRSVDGVESVLALQRLAGTYTPGTALTIRLEVSGTGPAALQAKAWPAGTAEPAAWTVTATDASASLQRPGAVFVETYTSASATRASVVRVDDLRAEPAGTVVAPPANAAPTADFTSSVADLKVSVDGTASADTDGTVAAYAWDFGDGSAPGSGATASHTYAAAGTYPVTLTVTDDKGATATRTRSVTVTAPAPAPDPAVQPLATDAFGREVATGWGTAERGGAWTVAGTAANASVTGGAGRLTAPAGNSMIAMLPGVSAQDLVLQADLTLPQAATGGGTYVGLGSRQVGSTMYQATVRFWSTGQVDLRLDRIVSGAETVVAIQRLPGSYVPGTSLTVRFEVSGTGTTELRAKAWTTGSAEPAAWTVSATDTTAGLQRPGAVLLETYTSGSATQASTLRVDNLWVGPAGSTPPAP